MGQTTQQVIRIKQNESQKPEVFALHNQRGFGRPLVTSSLNLVRAVLEEFKDGYPHTIDRRRCHVHSSMVNEEYFNNHEPYDCSFPFTHDEHDNDDGYSEIDIDCVNKTVTVKFFNYDGEEMLPLDYIVDCGCVEYCHDDRRNRFIETQQRIRNLDPNYKHEDD